MPAGHQSQAGRSRVERFLAHLDDLSGGVEPAFLPVPSTHRGLRQLTVMSYTDLPEPGMLTAITYGLSLAQHPQWTAGKPELCISVESTDQLWAQAVGYIAEKLRGVCPFCYGDTLNFGEQIAPESAMTAFVVFAPAVLPVESYLRIDVGDDLPITIAGFYPIHDSELSFIHDKGSEEFWGLDWNPYDVRRPSAL
ncbi:MAG TPA: suppressor of fused domain protein [Propionibacteriaceae bacterium]